MLCSVTRNTTEKKSPEVIRQELLASIVEISDEDDSELNKAVRNAKEPKEAMLIIKKYEELFKEELRKIINIVEKQEEVLIRFKKSDEFFSGVGPSRANFCFKIC